VAQPFHTSAVLPSPGTSAWHLVLRPRQYTGWSKNLNRKVPDISQGSVATHLMCGRMFSDGFIEIYCQSVTESCGERTLKIVQHLANLQAIVLTAPL